MIDWLWCIICNIDVTVCFGAVWAVEAPCLSSADSSIALYLLSKHNHAAACKEVGKLSLWNV